MCIHRDIRLACTLYLARYKTHADDLYFSVRPININPREGTKGVLLCVSLLIFAALYKQAACTKSEQRSQ